MILTPWTKSRLLREALAQGQAALQREQELRALTGWDLDNLNDAIAHGDVEIVPSEEVRTMVSKMARTSAYSLREITEMMGAISHWDFKRSHHEKLDDHAHGRTR